MAKLPPNLSLQAIPIRSALSEGRDADARRMIVELLRAGQADRVVQGIAADLLLPTKRGRGRRQTLPQHWFEIAEAFNERRESGVNYEDAIRLTAEQFGYSESHVRNSITDFESASEIR